MMSRGRIDGKKIIRSSRDRLKRKTWIKSVPMGGTPYSFLSSTSFPRDASPPIRSLGWLSKTRCAPSLSFISHCPIQLFSHDGSVLGKACFADRAPRGVIGPAQSRVASPVEENLFKHPVQTQPYHRVDQPVPDAPLGMTLWLARWILRCIAAKWLVSSCRFCSESIHSFPLYSFPCFVVVFPDLEFRRHVLWPTHLCLCPRWCRLNWAARFLVPICSS